MTNGEVCALRILVATPSLPEEIVLLSGKTFPVRFRSGRKFPVPARLILCLTSRTEAAYARSEAEPGDNRGKDRKDIDGKGHKLV
jgi:hypothetical protein